MTNKRKRRARALSKKTGLSHAGAINALNRNKLEVDLQPVEAKDLFLEKKYNPEEGFFRAPDEKVYWIGPNGDNILMADKSHRIVPELATYRADFVNEAGEELGVNHEAIEAAIKDRMEALMDCFVLNPDELVVYPWVRSEEFGPYLLKHFQGQRGVVRVYRPKTQLRGPDNSELRIGVLDHAGFIIRDEGYPLRAAMLVFSGRMTVAWVS